MAPFTTISIKGKNLEETPTYRVAVIVFVFVAASLMIEEILHRLSHWLEHKKKVGLRKAVEKLKDELMLLGLISLILSVAAQKFSRMCVEIVDNWEWLPCKQGPIEELRTKRMEKMGIDKETYDYIIETKGIGGCSKPGHEPWITFDAANYLHYLIFLLAVVVIVYASGIFLLAFMRVRQWRPIEDCAQEDADKLEGMSNDERLKTAGLKTNPFLFYGIGDAGGNIFNRIIFWFTSFCLLPFRSVSTEQYKTLRMLFLVKHNLPMRYDFHEFITRSMEEDFANLVGIPPAMWMLLVILLLADMAEVHLFFWCQLFSIALILIVGTKCLAIVRILSREATFGTGLFVCTDPKPTDQLFWFGKPKILLELLHFVVFANSLDMASLLFYRWKFYDVPCLVQNWGQDLTWVRISLSLITLFFSAFVTLPVFAIVSQMGSESRMALHSKRDHHGHDHGDDGGHDDGHHDEHGAHAKGAGHAHGAKKEQKHDPEVGDGGHIKRVSGKGVDESRKHDAGGVNFDPEKGNSSSNRKSSPTGNSGSGGGHWQNYALESNTLVTTQRPSSYIAIPKEERKSLRVPPAGRGVRPASPADPSAASYYDAASRQPSLSPLEA